MWEMKVKMKVLVTQSSPTLCDPLDYSPPGSSVHGILQARILEWVAISFSKGSSWPGIKPGSPTSQADSLPSDPPGKLSMGEIALSKKKKKIKNFMYNVAHDSDMY